MTALPQRASFNSDGIQVAWDAHSYAAWDTCPRLYKYTILDGWTHPTRNVHLWFGGIYAAAHELYHDLIGQGIDREAAIREVVHFALIESWTHDRDAEGNRIPGTGHPTTYPDNKKTRENLIRTLVWYFEEFKDESVRTYITAEGNPAVEHSFQLPVDNDITFCGHIDRLVQDEYDNIYVQDQKTTGQTLGPYYFDQYKPHHQVSMYTFVGQALYHAPVKGVIIDAAQIVVGFSKFMRYPVLQTKMELNEWYEETIDGIVDAQKMIAEKRFPKRPPSCSAYGGCPFRPVCSRPEGVRENFLEAEFVKRDTLWDPIKPR